MIVSSVCVNKHQFKPVQVCPCERYSVTEGGKCGIKNDWTSMTQCRVSRKALCFVLRALSHVLASNASETRLIRDSGKALRCPCMVLSIQEQERKSQGPWDSDKRKDVTLVPFWRASRITLHSFTLHTTYPVNCPFPGDG